MWELGYLTGHICSGSSGVLAFVPQRLRIHHPAITFTHPLRRVRVWSAAHGGSPQAIVRTATDVVVGTRFGDTFAFGLEDGSLRWHLPVVDRLRGVTPDGKQVVAWNTLYEAEPELARVRDLTLRQEPGIGPGQIEAVAPDLSYYMECTACRLVWIH